MLDLQAANRSAAAGRGLAGSSFVESQLGSIVFERVVGSIGASVGFEGDNSDAEETAEESGRSSTFVACEEDGEPSLVSGPTNTAIIAY